MRLLLLTVLLAVLSAPVSANEAPAVPEGGLSLVLQQSCVDNESGQKGDCYLMQAMDGKMYLTFWQGGIMMFIREVVGDIYTNIWVNDQFNSI